MRLHRPAGFYAFHVPHVVGTLWAPMTAESLPQQTSQLLQSNLIFLIGCLFLRGAACCWNDTLDAPYDRAVARCRHRPVARGAVSTGHAHTFTFVQSLVCLGLLYALPRTCLVPALMLVITMALYPFGKRFTHYPQVLLGFSLAFGQLVGAGAMGLDTTAPMSVGMKLTIACLYLANVLNTVIYDAVYAHQDLHDDIKAGLKSVAVAWQGYAKPVLSILATAEVALLHAAGGFVGFGWLYEMFAVVGTTLTFALMVCRVDLERPDSCAWWFQNLIWWTGGTLILGLFLEYAYRQ